MTGYIRLKVRELLREAGTNLHQAHLKGGFSYPTMHRYQRYPDQIDSLHTPSLVALLIDALGWTPAEVEATPFGHFFEIMIDGEREPLDDLAFINWLMQQQLGIIDKIGDPVLDHVTDETLDRLQYLLEARTNGEPVDAAAWRKYMICLMRNRVDFWRRLAPDFVIGDEQLAALSQAMMERLDELDREE